MRTSTSACKQQLINYYQRLRRYGYNDSHSGNASVKENNIVWVTPSGAAADDLLADQLIACNPDETPADGSSLDAPLHLACYQHNPKTNAVLHSHGAYTLAITFSGDDFIPIDFEGAYYFPKVPVLDIPYAEYVARSPEEVGRSLAQYPVVVVRGHGTYAAAENLDLAYKWTCALELSAKTAYLVRQMR